MPVTGIEALADGIMAFEGWRPGSRSYRNRNPGNLRDSPVPHTLDVGDYCVFADFLTGYGALKVELESKVTGINSHGIGPDSTLEQLFDVYAPRADHNEPNEYAAFMGQFCSTALGRSVTSQSSLRSIASELFQGEST